jgi:1-phosphatidylinositol-3-phosphate 5-kinase
MVWDLSSPVSLCYYLQSPLSPQEHHLVPTGGCSVPVVVYENEPSSIIAYALSSQEYQRSLDDMLAKRLTTNEQATPRYLFCNHLFGN